MFESIAVFVGNKVQKKWFSSGENLYAFGNVRNAASNTYNMYLNMAWGLSFKSSDKILTIFHHKFLKFCCISLISLVWMVTLKLRYFFCT